MQAQSAEPTKMSVHNLAPQPTRKSYRPPTLTIYGNMRHLTQTNAEGPNFDGGGGANIYAS